MKKVITVKEYLAKLDEELGTIWTEDNESIEKAFIDFAKLHVIQALKEALESIPCLGSSSDIPTYEEVESAVLNAYPETNII